MIYKKFDNGIFYQADTFDAMAKLPDNSIDMVLCDLPYGTTQCKWDAIIPFDELWKEYYRISKEAAPIVLTASQPFTSALIMSNVKDFKYCWVWNKVNKFTGSLNANRMPMLDYEDVAVFYRKQCVYNKQLRPGSYVTRHTNGDRNTDTVGKSSIKPDVGRKVDGLNPKRIIDFPSQTTKNIIHPTQKPVSLFEYFIKTYTNENAIVLDNTAGSGTTAIAAINTKRRWICIERDETYYNAAIDRIEKHTIGNF